MMPRLPKLSRLLLIPALMVSFVACDTTVYKVPADQKATPVQPVFIFVALSSDRTVLSTTSGIQAKLRFVAYDNEWNPLPDQTKVDFSSNLGNFQSQGGPQKLTLELFDGEINTLFYPGGTPGIARITASVLGEADLVEIEILQ